MAKINEVGTIKNTDFASLEAKARVRIAGVILRIDDKETAYAPVKRFRGDFAIAVGEAVSRAKTAFFPRQISDVIVAAAQKAGKWDSLEFVAVVVKNDKEARDLYSVTFETAPRQTAPRVLELLG